MIGLKSERGAFVDGVRPASVWIEGERIARVGAFDEPGARETACAILPGIVDTHVHVNEPGRTAWEGFETATRAAAAGGVTTIVDMPLNSIPATTSARALLEKAEALEGKCAVDVGLWGGAVPGNARALREMVRAGALGFKCFLVDSGVAELPHLDVDQMEDAMRELDGAPLLVHAELPISSGPRSATRAATRRTCARDRARRKTQRWTRSSRARRRRARARTSSTSPPRARSRRSRAGRRASPRRPRRIIWRSSPRRSRTARPRSSARRPSVKTRTGASSGSVCSTA